MAPKSEAAKTPATSAKTVATPNSPNANKRRRTETGSIDLTGDTEDEFDPPNEVVDGVDGDGEHVDDWELRLDTGEPVLDDNGDPIFENTRWLRCGKAWARLKTSGSVAVDVRFKLYRTAALNPWTGDPYQVAYSFGPLPLESVKKMPDYPFGEGTLDDNPPLRTFQWSEDFAGALQGFHQGGCDTYKDRMKALVRRYTSVYPFSEQWDSHAYPQGVTGPPPANEELIGSLRLVHKSEKFFLDNAGLPDFTGTNDVTIAAEKLRPILDREGELNDEVVDSFLHMVSRYSSSLAPRDKRVLIAAFSSGLWQSLPTLSIKERKAWAKRQNLDDETLQTFDFIAVPLNTGSHWVLFTVVPKSRVIRVHDSISHHKQGDYVKYRKALAGFIRDVCDVPPEEWNFRMTKLPAQTDKFACGVITCWNAAQMVRVGNASDRAESDLQHALTLPEVRQMRYWLGMVFRDGFDRALAARVH
ncbi:hypothetical protein LTR17_027031 [Elasticomyces elasticus]|nr:hypothetical protein LTR17_027031 [Elasticomyces elasticus]